MDSPVKDMIRTSAVGEFMQQCLTEGVPEIGWDGDPWLTLCWNKLELRYEVWDERPERPRLVYRTRQFASSEELPDIYQLCAHLRDHDLRKRTVDDIIRDMDRKNDAIGAADRDKYFQQQCAALEKVYWAAGRDQGIKLLW